MDHIRVAIEITKLRPHWPTRSIIAILDHPRTKWMTEDPRTKSADLADMLVHAWDAEAPAA